MLSEVHCDDKTCEETLEFEAKCPIYVGLKPACNPPCELAGCEVEFEYNVLCSKWTCTSLSTTTTGPWTTSSSSTTTGPDSRYFLISHINHTIFI